MIKRLSLFIATISCLLCSCKKKEQEINVSQPWYEERRELSLSDLYPKEGTYRDTLVLYGSFITENVTDVKVYFTNPDLSYTVVSPIGMTPTELSVIVPELEHYYKYQLEAYITIDDTTYAGHLNSPFAYNDGRYDNDPNYVPPTTFWPDKVRRGQTITFTGSYYNTPKNDIRVKFAGTSEWQSPVAYDSFDYRYIGPVYRIPENATNGPIQVWSGKRFKPTESRDMLTLLPSMPSLQRNVWTPQANFASRSENDSRENGEAREGAAVFVINDKVYVACGYTGAPFDEYGTNTLWEYDPKYNSWIQRASFPGGKRTHPVAFAIGNKGYVGTGIDKNRQLRRDFWAYDPQTDTWEQKADFIGEERRNAVGFAIDNKGYIGSGTNDREVFGDFYSYNPANNTWSAISPIPQKRSAAYVFVVNGKAYIGGGKAGDEPLKDLYVYHPATNSWKIRNGIPDYAYTCQNASFSLNGKGYVGLGYDNTRHISYIGNNAAFRYSPESDRWESLPNVGEVERAGGIGFSIGNAGYFGLGLGAMGMVGYQDIWGYIP